MQSSEEETKALRSPHDTELEAKEPQRYVAGEEEDAPRSFA